MNIQRNEWSSWETRIGHQLVVSNGLYSVFLWNIYLLLDKMLQKQLFINVLQHYHV
jgi:hypothetical protein